MEVLLCERVNDLRHSLFLLLNCLITTASELRELPKVIGQGLDYREADELSWCPSWSNSLWQGWRCKLVHCSGGNATDPIWRVLASSDKISSWTPLKTQHSNPNPNPLANHLFIKVYSNSCWSCSFEPEIIKIGQSSYKMYSNNILTFQASTTILNAHRKKSGILSYAPRMYKGDLALNNLHWLICYKS